MDDADLSIVFTKLASQLTTDKLADLAIIPVIFMVQTLVSFLCSFIVSKAFGFTKRPRNFVVAMGVRPPSSAYERPTANSVQVFGNSNSLPISLVISLSQTIKGLHWDRVPGDNDDEVAARGILYLLIFQQLGQLVRWSWGYNVLLAPPEHFEDTTEHTNSRLENGQVGLPEAAPLMRGTSTDSESDDRDASGSDDTKVSTTGDAKSSAPAAGTRRSGQQVFSTNTHGVSSISSGSSNDYLTKARKPPTLLPTPANGNVKPSDENEHMMSFPRLCGQSITSNEEAHPALKGIPFRIRTRSIRAMGSVLKLFSQTSSRLFKALPTPLQIFLTELGLLIQRFALGVWAFMNPPLWAMLAAIVVASVPDLQRFFFSNGTFFKNSVTSAIRQSGGVAVPLILVVLGANLARNTLPVDPNHTKEDDKEETKLLVASLISRMLLPVAIMAPLLALTAKYVPVSILDDPIFVIVCFLITGAPSALQLAQICQINNVYMGAMSRLLFQSYVVWILPSTLVLVMCALEVVEWAQR